MTEAFLAVLPVIVIGQYLTAAFRTHGARADGHDARAVMIASVGALATAILAAAGLALAGGAPAIGALGLFRVDALSAVMLLLISFLGLVILRFSINYLEGDRRRPQFLSRLSLALSGVVLLVTADNMLLLAAGWVATSAVLHRLLLHYPNRARAVVAARKKFLFARAADLLLVSAVALLFAIFGTLSIGGIMAIASGPEAASLPAVQLTAACLLLAGAAALKSAQFPTHGWLTEVMETPTPVSALLHAGIVNAGGFILIRFADVMVLSPAALTSLVVVGGFSALFGAVVMLTQTTVKGSLAHSTVAQMGFMLFQCGLGAFSAAALHLVAHSLYKAHAFLSSGRAVGAVALRKPAAEVNGAALVVGLGAALALYAGIGALFGGSVAKAPAILTLGAIFTAGLFVYIVSVTRMSPAFGIALGVSALGSVSYFALQTGAAALLGGILPPLPEPGPAGQFLMVLSVVSFVAVALFQAGAFPVGRRLAETAYVHLSRGLYANAVNDRLMASLRVRKSV